jgi:hypothetical protein
LIVVASLLAFLSVILIEIIMATLDAVQIAGLIKAFSNALDDLERRVPHPWGRLLIKLLQQPELDLGTYQAIAQEFSTMIPIWDEVSLKEVAENFVFWFVDLTWGEPTMNITIGSGWRYDFPGEVLDPISRHLCHSEWIWEELLKGEDGSPPSRISFFTAVSYQVAHLYSDAPAKFRASQQFVQRLLQKMPELILATESKFLHDKDVVAVMLSTDRFILHTIFDQDGIGFRGFPQRNSISWDHTANEIAEQLESLVLFRQTFLPILIKSSLNQGEEPTTGFIRNLSALIGLPPKEDRTVLHKAQENYESILPFVRTVLENAPLQHRDRPCPENLQEVTIDLDYGRPPVGLSTEEDRHVLLYRQELFKRQVLKNPNRAAEAMTVDEIVLGHGVHVTQSPLRPRNHRAAPRERKSVKPLSFSS